MSGFASMMDGQTHFGSLRRLKDRGGASSLQFMAGSTIAGAGVWADFAPPDIKKGDLIIATIGVTTGEPTLPTGYTELEYAVADNRRVKVVWRIAAGVADGFDNAVAQTNVTVIRNHGGIVQSAKTENTSTGTSLPIALANPPAADSAILIAAYGVNPFLYPQAIADVAGWIWPTPSRGVISRLPLTPPVASNTLTLAAAQPRAGVILEIAAK